MRTVKDDASLDDLKVRLQRGESLWEIAHAVAEPGRGPQLYRSLYNKLKRRGFQFPTIQEAVVRREKKGRGRWRR